MNKRTTLLCVTLGLFPVAAFAQSGYSSNLGPAEGDREFTLSGAGSSDKDFDSTNFGLSADIGWYRSRELLLGLRQSLNFADIEGESITNDYWNGSTRGYVNYHFGQTAWRPFVGASLGAVYGDGVRDSGFAGLEGGLKYYVLPKTFVMARAEYQWFFDRGSDINNQFDKGAWAYTLGLGYNF